MNYHMVLTDLLAWGMEALKQQKMFKMKNFGNFTSNFAV